MANIKEKQRVYELMTDINSKHKEVELCVPLGVYRKYEKDKKRMLTQKRKKK